MMKKKPATTTKNKKIEEGYVFKTAPQKLDDDVLSKAFSTLSYDPIEVTDKIIEFGKILTGLPLYDYQHEMAWRIVFSIVSLEGATLTCICSRQSGKTETVAFVIDTLAVILPALSKIFPELEQYSNGIKIGLFAPQSDQMETTYGRAMSRLGSENAHMIMSDPDIQTEKLSEAKLILSNGSYLTGQIASPKSKIESKTYDLIFIEECQDADSYIIEKSIEPMGSATNATIVKVGTTGTQKNDFYSEIQVNQSHDRKIRDARLKKHHQSDYLRVMKDKRKQYSLDNKIFHLNYEKFVLERKKKWGDNSDQFRLSYALIWALDSGMFITDREFNWMCNGRIGLQHKVEDDDFIVAGLDIAKDNASTVLTIVKVTPNDDPYKEPKKRVIQWIELSGIDYEMQHEIIVDRLVDYQVKILYADYTGVGKAVVDRLMYSCGDYVEVVPYTFSRPSKSDMWCELLADIQAKRLEIPGNKATKELDSFRNFEEQIKNLQKYYDAGYLVAEKSQGFYDDYADSLGLAILAANHQVEIEEEIEEYETNPFTSGVNKLIENSSW